MPCRTMRTRCRRSANSISWRVCSRPMSFTARSRARASLTSWVSAGSILARRTRVPGFTRSTSRRPGLRGTSGAEATSVLDGDQGLLAADLQLLHRPAVAVGIGEAEERAAISLVELHDLAHRDTPIEELLARRLGIGDDQLQALDRARRHLALRRQVAEDDRATRAVGRELHDVHVLVLRVVVEVKADLVAVERDRAVDVADGEDDDFEGPVHAEIMPAFAGAVREALADGDGVPRECALELGDLDLGHLQHRLHRPLRGGPIGTGEHLRELLRDHLPGQAESILEPAAD